VNIERLSPDRAGLLVIDLQERLVAAMPEEVMPQIVRNVKILIAAADRLGLPIVVSQQYPKGLGATIPDIDATLQTAANVYRYDKLDFSAACASPFHELRRSNNALARRSQWIVTGMETHVCVYQSVRDLVAESAVHVVSDATCSRSKHNWRAGLALAERCGAIVSTTEVCVFDLLARAGTDDFKALSKLVK
jgi:isochorismate hydrolase